MKGASVILPLVLALLPLSSLMGQEVDLASSYFHFTRAKMYEADSQWEEALAEYEKALQIDPQSGRLHYDFASALLQARRPNKAIAECEISIELDPGKAEAYLLLGQIYRSQLNDGQPEILDKAIDSFEKGLAIEASNIEGLFYLGRLYVFRGRNEDAVEVYGRLVEARPDILSAHQQRAESLMTLGKTAEAIEALEYALKYHRDNIELYLSLGRLLEQVGETDKALEVYDLSQQVQANPHVQFRQGSILLLSGRYEDAVERLRQATEGAPENLDIKVELGKALDASRDYQGAADVLETVLEKEPTKIEALYYSASALRALGRRQEAIARVQKLLDMTRRPAGDYTPQNTDYRARFKSFLALIFQEDRQYDEAIRLFREVMEDKPDDFRGKLGLIYALREADRIDEALQLSEELQNEEPEDVDILVTRARMQSAAGLLEAAVQSLEAELSGEPDSQEDIDLLLTQSQLYSEHEEFAKAETTIVNALRDRPQDERLRFQLGALRERQGKFDEAEVAFREVLEADPEHAAVLNYLGYMLADMGVRLEEARDYIQKALEKDPYNGSYLDSLGWVYFKLDDLELAEKNLVLASQINDADPTILEHLGDLYYKLGDLNKARQYYEQSVHFAEEEDEKVKVEEKLAALLKELSKSN